MPCGSGPECSFCDIAAPVNALFQPGQSGIYIAAAIDRTVSAAWGMTVGAKVWGASGSAVLEADVLIEGNRIRTVIRASGQLSQVGCQAIDGKGSTLIRGLVEGPMRRIYDGLIRGEDLTCAAAVSSGEVVKRATRQPSTLLQRSAASVRNLVVDQPPSNAKVCPFM
jgi:hypothetical protein